MSDYESREFTCTQCKHRHQALVYKSTKLPVPVCCYAALCVTCCQERQEMFRREQTNPKSNGIVRM